MKFRLRLRLRKKSRAKMKSRLPALPLSNNMSPGNDGGGGDDRQKLWRTVPPPVNEQQIANAQMKVDHLINLINDTYEQTLVRNLHLENLDMRSSDLFRDAEKMKNMAHKMQDKFFWEDSE